jgi:hypothetical protein
MDSPAGGPGVENDVFLCAKASPKRACVVLALLCGQDQQQSKTNKTAKTPANFDTVQMLGTSRFSTSIDRICAAKFVLAAPNN